MGGYSQSGRWWCVGGGGHLCAEFSRVTAPSLALQTVIHIQILHDRLKHFSQKQLGWHSAKQVYSHFMLHKLLSDIFPVTRESEENLSSSATFTWWNMAWMSPMNATGSCLKRVRTPSSEMVVVVQFQTILPILKYCGGLHGFQKLEVFCRHFLLLHSPFIEITVVLIGQHFFQLAHRDPIHHSKGTFCRQSAMVSIQRTINVVELPGSIKASVSMTGFPFADFTLTGRMDRTHTGPYRPLYVHIFLDFFKSRLGY